MRSYSLIFSHRSSSLGSFCGRLAFMGKPVLGRLTVDFRSNDTQWFSPKVAVFFIIGSIPKDVHSGDWSSRLVPKRTLEKHCRKAIKSVYNFWKGDLSRG